MLAFIAFAHKHLGGNSEGAEVKVDVHHLLQVLVGLAALDEVLGRVFMQVFWVSPVPLHHDYDSGRDLAQGITVDQFDLPDEVEMPE